MQKLKDEIQEKKRQMKLLEQRIGTADGVPASSSSFEMSQVCPILFFFECGVTLWVFSNKRTLRFGPTLSVQHPY